MKTAQGAGSDRIAHDGGEELERAGYLVVHLPAAVRRRIARLSSTALHYFSLPEPEQRANVLAFGCGHWAYGVEHSGLPEDPDRVSFFGASARTAAAAQSLPSPVARSLHAQLLELFGTFEALAEDLMVDIASRFGIGSPEALRGGLRDYSMIQISRSLPTPEGEPIYHEHEDGHLLSIAQANGRGLEIRTEQGYRPAPYSPESLLVMPGELLRLLTGGRVSPLFHRVRSVTRKRPRLALLFFADLDPDYCTPWDDRLADKARCGAQVLSNAARFGMPGFTPDGPGPAPIPSSSALPDLDPVDYERPSGRTNSTE